MDQEKTFAETLKDYTSKLNALQDQCAEAERQCIIADTNLKTLKKNQQELIAQCEALAGRPIDEVPEFLKEQMSKLTEVMGKLQALNVSGEITQETMDAIQSLVDEYQIS